MRFTWVITSPLFLVRMVLGLLMLGYLLVMIESHSVPLSGALRFPMIATAVVAAVGVGLLSALLSKLRGDDDDDDDYTDWGMGWRWIAHLAFASAAGFACYFAFTGNAPSACPRDAQFRQDNGASCLKLDNWRTSGDHYYVQYPYDSSGSDDPGAPWVEISRSQYVAEHGTTLRSEVGFGVFLLSVAWLLSAGLGPIRRD
jgi:hypothetical protein